MVLTEALQHLVKVIINRFVHRTINSLVYQCLSFLF